MDIVLSCHKRKVVKMKTDLFCCECDQSLRIEEDADIWSNSIFLTCDCDGSDEIHSSVRGSVVGLAVASKSGAFLNFKYSREDWLRFITMRGDIETGILYVPDFIGWVELLHDNKMVRLHDRKKYKFKEYNSFYFIGLDENLSTQLSEQVIVMYNRFQSNSTLLTPEIIQQLGKLDD